MVHRDSRVYCMSMSIQYAKNVQNNSNFFGSQTKKHMMNQCILIQRLLSHLSWIVHRRIGTVTDHHAGTPLVFSASQWQKNRQQWSRRLSSPWGKHRCRDRASWSSPGGSIAVKISPASHTQKTRWSMGWDWWAHLWISKSDVAMNAWLPQARFIPVVTFLTPLAEHFSDLKDR